MRAYLNTESIEESYSPVCVQCAYTLTDITGRFSSLATSKVDEWVKSALAEEHPDVPEMPFAFSRGPDGAVRANVCVVSAGTDVMGCSWRDCVDDADVLLMYFNPHVRTYIE